VPAPAVIPAPIAYIKVVAVKKLVVEPQGLGGLSVGSICTAPLDPLFGRGGLLLTEWAIPSEPFTLKKLECLKQAIALNILAWDNGIGPRSCLLVLRTGVMINSDRWGYSYLIVRGEILGFMKDEPQRKHLPQTLALIKNES
jgi:hypothetical protein